MGVRVRMLSTAAGPLGVWPAGAIIEVDAAEAQALCEARAAEEVDPLPVAQEIEEADSRKRRSKKASED